MVLQVAGITLILLAVRWPPLRPYAVATMWGVVLFGLVSAFDYFQKFWKKVDSSIKLRRRNEIIEMERQKRRMLRAAAKLERNAAAEKAESVRRSV
jgi:hypothetical protein